MSEDKRGGCLPPSRNDGLGPRQAEGGQFSVALAPETRQRGGRIVSVRTVILLWIIAGYLCGSISLPIAGRLARVDIVGDSADGNPGGANVFLMVGKTAGVLVVLLDIAKGALPVWLFNRYVGFTEPLRCLFYPHR